jgi:hypothetical protein
VLLSCVCGWWKQCVTRTGVGKGGSVSEEKGASANSAGNTRWTIKAACVGTSSVSASSAR